MKASSSFPVLSAIALAFGISGAYGQPQSPAAPASPATPPAAAPAAPSSSASSSGAPPSAGADSAASDRSGNRYGRGYRAGPGMMGDGYGPGMMGGYGPGMMGGYGPGYGGGESYGPGGYGPGYGMGRGGYGPGPGFGGPGAGCGWGMGHGMMGGPGWGMGPGMMGGPGPGWHRGRWGALGSLDLDDAQRKQLRELQQQQRRKNWALMGQIQDEMDKLQDAWGSEPGTRNRAAILAANQRIAELHQQMLESRLDAAEQFEKILTPAQREQLHSQRGAASGRARR